MSGPIWKLSDDVTAVTVMTQSGNGPRWRPVSEQVLPCRPRRLVSPIVKVFGRCARKVQGGRMM